MRLLCIVLFAILTVSAQACEDTLGAKDTDLLLSASTSLSKETCILAKNLVLPPDSVITTNGHKLSIDAENLIISGSATIRAFNYAWESEQSAIPPPKGSDLPVAFPSWDPGPTNGSGQGRNGGKVVKGLPMDAASGRPGMSAGDVEIHVAQSGAGTLNLQTMGSDGQRGADGTRGWSGGNGEQGTEGRGNPICSNGPGIGGRGGDGRFGDNGGHGGAGGDGAQLIIDVGSPSPRFKVNANVQPGVPGAAGLPGPGGLPGLQGCGGRGGPCISKEIERQGLLGNPGVAGKLGQIGMLGNQGSIKKTGTFKLTEVGQPNQCEPLTLSQPERDFIDAQANYAFWTLGGYRLLGSTFKVVPTNGGGDAFVINPDWRNGILSFVNPLVLIGLVQKPLPLPAPIPANCAGSLCCAGSPSIECLSASRWSLGTNPNGLDRYRDRLKWKDEVIKLLHIELSKTARQRSSGTSEQDFLTGGKVYLQIDSDKYLIIDDELFARLVATIGALIPSVRVALDARVAHDRTSLQCSSGSPTRTGGPKFYTKLGTDILVDSGWNVMFAQSSPAGFQLNSPNIGNVAVVLPIASFRSETIFDPPVIQSISAMSTWGGRPGFHEGGFCKIMSPKPMTSRDDQLNCGGKGATLLNDIRPRWHNFDTPTMTFILAAVLYLDVASRANYLDFNGGSQSRELALHCFQ
ncbi:hypothetical protein V1294_006048 [Bradyrhizobium sp. AZCC 1678]|uniref:hypothetical protein n=1 Tax=Bradyrhizobium sp. AZCC 1678 TaxID=3117030 RepID=UPI002FF3C631